MNSKDMAVFTVDGVNYPITMTVCDVVKDYLYKNENVNWVSFESPHIKYQIKMNNQENKIIKRQLHIILSNSEIGDYVINNVDLTPIDKS